MNNCDFLEKYAKIKIFHQENSLFSIIHIITKIPSKSVYKQKSLVLVYYFLLTIQCCLRMLQKRHIWYNQNVTKITLCHQNPPQNFTKSTYSSKFQCGCQSDVKLFSTPPERGLIFLEINNSQTVLCHVL